MDVETTRIEKFYCKTNPADEMPDTWFEITIRSPMTDDEEDDPRVVKIMKTMIEEMKAVLESSYEVVRRTPD